MHKPYPSVRGGGLFGTDGTGSQMKPEEAMGE